MPSASEYIEKLRAMLGDKVLDFHNAAGAYNPVFNFTLTRSDLPDDGYVGGQNVARHEGEHKRQFNNPGDYTSEKAMQIAERYVPELKKRYSRAELPKEMLAHMAGSQPDYANPNTYDQEVYTKFGTTKPHPGWDVLDDEAKEWYLKNQMSGWLDEGFQRNKELFGESPAQTWERLKHIGSDLTNRVVQKFKPPK